MRRQDPVWYIGKGRLEAFSDGVFAIAITLLILDLVAPTGLAAGTSAFRVAVVPRVRRELPDDRRSLAQPHRVHGPAGAGGPDLPADQLAPLAGGCVPAVPDATRGRIAGAVSHGERVFVTMYGLTLLAIRIFHIRPRR